MCRGREYRSGRGKGEVDKGGSIIKLRLGYYSKVNSYKGTFRERFFSGKKTFVSVL